MSATETTPAAAAPIRPGFQERPRRLVYRGLVLATWVLAVGLLLYFLMATRGTAVPAATQVGRIYGLVGAVIFIYLVLYGLRRIAYRTGPAPLEWWYRSHLLLGFLALVMVGAHSGFALRSPFLVALQIGFWGTMLTGVYGWVYLSLLKRWMLKHEYRPTVMKELNARRAEELSRLAALKSDTGPEQSAITQGHRAEAIDRAIAQMALRRATHIWRLPDWTFWEQQVASVAGGLGNLPPAARDPILDLNRIEVLRSYHRGLRFWTNFHLALGVLGIQMMLWHIWVVAVYPR